MLGVGVVGASHLTPKKIFKECLDMKNYLLGYQHLNYTNQEGKHIDGYKIDLASQEFGTGVGMGVNSFFTNNPSIIDTLKNLDFSSDDTIYSCDVGYSISNCKLSLKSISSCLPIIID